MPTSQKENYQTQTTKILQYLESRQYTADINVLKVQENLPEANTIVDNPLTTFNYVKYSLDELHLTSLSTQEKANYLRAILDVYPAEELDVSALYTDTVNKDIVSVVITQLKDIYSDHNLVNHIFFDAAFSELQEYRINNFNSPDFFGKEDIIKRSRQILPTLESQPNPSSKEITYVFDLIEILPKGYSKQFDIVDGIRHTGVQLQTGVNDLSHARKHSIQSLLYCYPIGYRRSQSNR